MHFQCNRNCGRNKWNGNSTHRYSRKDNRTAQNRTSWRKKHTRTHTLKKSIAWLEWRVEKSTCFSRYLSLCECSDNHHSQDILLRTQYISPVCSWNFKRLYIKSLSIRIVRVIHFVCNKKTHTQQQQQQQSNRHAQHTTYTHYFAYFETLEHYLHEAPSIAANFQLNRLENFAE